MAWLAALSLDQFLVFTLVLSRVSGLVIGAPLYGGNEAPPQVRVLLAVALALLLTPSQLGVVATPNTVLGYLLVIGGELLIGLTLGLGLMVLFSGVQLAGQIIGQTSGMTLAEVFNPGLDASVPLLSQLMHMVAMAVFVIVGGHRLLIAGLLDTFAVIPPGNAGLNSLGDSAVALLTQSFSLGIRAAAPATMALLVATLVIGLVGRTMPQLNVMALGFGLNAMVTLAVLSVSIGGLAWIFQDEIEPALTTILQSLVPATIEG